MNCDKQRKEAGNSTNDSIEYHGKLIGYSIRVSLYTIMSAAVLYPLMFPILYSIQYSNLMSTVSWPGDGDWANSRKIYDARAAAMSLEAWARTQELIGTARFDNDEATALDVERERMIEWLQANCSSYAVCDQVSELRDGMWHRVQEPNWQEHEKKHGSIWKASQKRRTYERRERANHWKHAKR